LRLVAGRTLYDGGRAVSGSPAISGLAPNSSLAISDTDLHRLGVAPGDEVKVTSSRGSIRTRVVARAGVPQGVAQLAFTADGEGVAELLDSSSIVTDLRVETL
jgi:anaerobic selenocysteine-containing dehydrogenase